MSDRDDWRSARRSRNRRGGGADDDFPGWDGGASPPLPSFAAPAQSRPWQASTQASGPDVGAVVKRFDGERGFGFVALDGGGGDAFLHVSVLRRAGLEAVAVGARLRVRTGQGQKGPQVTEVLEVSDAGGAAPPRAKVSAWSAAPPSVEGQEVRGTVKWYSAEKGFGFVTPDDGGRDVFVHATALERSGFPALTEGQAVVLRVVQGKKGLEAETVSNP